MLFKKENYQIKTNSIGFYQDLEHVDGVGISAVSANLYLDKKRDELVIFYFFFKFSSFDWKIFTI